MHLLNELIGRKVTVFSLQGGGAERQDVGVLEAVDGNWLKVRKGEETLFFHSHHIRLVKPFDAH